MSAKRYSPTASALRSSRFFSIPPPLPRPKEFITSNTFVSNAQSPTATLPHPVQQAIGTTASARSRGDWGLKRSLPRRSTKHTSDPPVFRVNAVDTREQITDFDTATDLTVTRAKYLELGIPLSIPEERVGIQAPTAASPFETSTDNTDSNVSIKDPRTGQPITRWKFEGPWLAGLSEQEFLDYVDKELYGRKDEFLAFMREHEAQRLEQERRHGDATKYGRGFGRKLTPIASSASPASSSSGTLKPESTSLNMAESHPEAPSSSSSAVMADEDFAAYLHQIRTSFSTTSALADLVTRFLDLPTLKPTVSTSQMKGIPSSDHDRFIDSSSYAIKRTVATGPSSTHPSGGLSYLRTDAVLPSHRVFGALAQQPPATARILSKHDQNQKKQGYLGLAGFVVPALKITYENRKPTAAVRMQTVGSDAKNDPVHFHDGKIMSPGVSLDGGNRLWVKPEGGYVDESGRVHLRLGEVTDEMIDGKTEDLGGSKMITGSSPPTAQEEERMNRQLPSATVAQLDLSNLGRTLGLPSKNINTNDYGLPSSRKENNGPSKEVQGDESSSSQPANMSGLFNALSFIDKERPRRSGRRGK